MNDERKGRENRRDVYDEKYVKKKKKIEEN